MVDIGISQDEMIRHADGGLYSQYSFSMDRGGHTPGGISHPWTFRTSLGAIRGRRDVTTADRRRPSFITPFYTESALYYSIARVG